MIKKVKKTKRDIEKDKEMVRLSIDYINACNEQEAKLYKMNRKEVLYKKWKEVKNK